MQGKTSVYHQTQDQLSSENKIVEAAKKNLQMFEPLYNKYYEQIFRYIYQKMQFKELAHDITSQVFLKAMNNLHNYKFKGVPFSSWLFRIAMSEVYQSFKDNKAQRTINFETNIVNDIIDEINDEKNELHIKLVIEKIAELPDNELEIIELRFFEQLPYKQISEILNISESNAKVKTHRILKKLKTMVV